MKYAGYSPWKGELMVRRLSGRVSAGACGAFFVHGWFSLIAVISGEIEIHMEGSTVPVKLSEGRLCGVSVGAVVSEVAVPLECYVLSCTIALAVNGRIARYAIGYIEAVASRSVSVLPVSNADLRHIIDLMQMLKRKIEASSDQPLQDELVMLCLNLLLYEYSAHYFKNSEDQNVFHSWDEKIAMGFIALLDGSAARHHDVKYYADALCISDQHLRKAVRRATGTSAKYFITARLVSEALVLLANDNLSVSEISERLNFGKLSSFSSFFKIHAKLTPSEYRKRLRS